MAVYKRASRSLLSAHKVDRILPTGGYINAPDDPTDIIKLPETMTLQEVRDEQHQLKRETLRLQSDLAVAKIANQRAEIARLGQALAVMANRGGLLKERAHQLNRQDMYECLYVAIKEICSPDMVQQITDRHHELFKNSM